MAEVDNIVRFEQTNPSLEVVRALLTATGTSTFTSKFGTVTAVSVDEEGTNGATWTRSGNVITITGTNNDVVHIMVWGN